MNPEKHPPINPFFAIIIGIFAVSTASLLIRQAQLYAPSIVIASFRLGAATLLITPIVIGKRRQELGSITKSEYILALLSGAFLALHFAAWIKSLEYTTVASSVVLVSTAPLWVAMLSPFTIKEPLTKPIIFGLLFVMGGVILVTFSDTCVWNGYNFSCPSMEEFLRGEAFLGDVLALIGAVAASIYIIIGRSLRSRVSLLSYVFVVYGMAAVILCIFMLVSGNSLVGYPTEAYFWMLLLAVIPQLFGHSIFNYALGYLSAAFVSISLLGEPVGSTILAYFFLGEVPTPLKILGAGLILAGIYIASRVNVQRVQSESVTSQIKLAREE
jgi:drug/metabolite transporter (DMT)-like permease